MVEKTEEWLGAEAERDGRPLVVRARRFFREPVADPSLPFLFVVELQYEPFDDVGLPGDSQYEVISKFERDVFDLIESKGILNLVFVETNAGSIRYYSYVSDIEVVSSKIDEMADEALILSFSADEDPEWNEYRKRMDRVS